MSFTLCSIHVIFISNEFHEICMSSDCRSRCTKNEQKWVKTQAEQPLLGRPAWHLWIHSPGFDPVAMWHSHNALSRGLGLRLIRWTKRHRHESKNPQDSTRSSVNQWSISLDKIQAWRETSAQQRAEMGQREASRPPLGRPAYNCQCSGHATNTDPRRQSGMSMQRWWPDGCNPRPAGLGEAGRPHFAAFGAGSWRGSYCTD